MIDSGQLMEKFRHLSRNIQLGLQSGQKHVEAWKRSGDASEIGKLEVCLNQIADAWSDYSGWVLLSTLDDIEEARANCAPGLVDLRSKIFRSKSRRQGELSSSGVKVEMDDAQSFTVETYIAYFEQALDLILGNAIKYSTRGGVIEISAVKENTGARLMVQSIGPTVLRHEVERLGEKEFRSENAVKTAVPGQGYGLYNVKRIADLIGAKVQFKADQKVLVHSGGIPQSNFSVTLLIPDSVQRNVGG